MSDDQKPLVIELPLRLVSEMNARDGWRARAKRMKEHRFVTRASINGRYRAGYHMGYLLPCTVTITRIGPKTLDSDNAAGAAKGVRDGVADALGIDDADPAVIWEYRQEKRTKARASKLATYAVRIEIRTRDAVAPGATMG